MAELIITEEERYSLTFLEWDDESLGKAVKKVATILSDNDGSDSLRFAGAAAFLVDAAIRSNSENSTFDFDGLKIGKKSLGCWRIVLENLEREL